MQWYYAANGQSVGPVSDEEIQKLVFSGTINGQTLVWHEGMTDWVKYETLNQPAEAAAPAHAPSKVEHCCECGKEFFTNDLIKYENSLVCAACKPVFFQRLQEGAALPGILEYAGFWTRFGAKFLDGIIMSIVSVILSVASVGLVAANAAKSKNVGAVLTTQLIIFLIQMLFQMAYQVGFLGKYGATPGKMACKIKVVRPDGSPITYGRACGRYFGEMLSGMILCVGYIMAAFDDEKRALHDRICDTRVIRSS